MNWKLIITILFLIAATYAVAMAIQFYLAGNPLTPQGFASYTLNTTLNTVNTVTSYIQDKLQLVIGGVGAAITAIATTYRLMQNRVTATKQAAETQIDTVQSNATQQYVTMQNAITTQGKTITGLQSELATSQQKLADATTEQENAALWKSNYEKLQNDYNIMEQTLQNQILKLKQETVTIYK